MPLFLTIKVSFRGLHKLRPRPDWSLLGFKFKISAEHPRPFHMGDPHGVYHVKSEGEREKDKIKYIIPAKFYLFIFVTLTSSSALIHMLCKVRSENGYGFLRPGLKTGVENGIFWSEIGSGFGDAGGTPPPKIPRSTPLGLESNK